MQMQEVKFNEKNYKIIERRKENLKNIECEKIIYIAKSKDGHIENQHRFVYKNLSTNKYFLI